MEDIMERFDKAGSLLSMNASVAVSLFKDARDEIAALRKHVASLSGILDVERAAAATVKAERDALRPRDMLAHGSPLHTALRELSEACIEAELCPEGDTWVNIVKAGAIGVRAMTAGAKERDDLQRNLVAMRAERDDAQRYIRDIRADLDLSGVQDLRTAVRGLRDRYSRLQGSLRALLDNSA